MSTALIAILVSIIAGIGFARGLLSDSEAKRSKTGWFGLGLLALLLGGLWASGKTGHEPAAYGFGIAISLVLPIMLLAGVASAIGRTMRKRKGHTK